MNMRNKYPQFDWLSDDEFYARVEDHLKEQIYITKMMVDGQRKFGKNGPINKLKRLRLELKEFKEYLELK